MSQQTVSLIECPRDAMQGWPRMIATNQKIRYINSLLAVGFDTIDFGSFVSAKAIPQMSDTSQVIAGLDKTASSTKLLAIVANQRGAEEALAHDIIDYLGFPFSVSPTFQQKNTNSTIEESLERVETIQNLCIKSGKQLVVYLSMGFGNPYGDEYNAAILLNRATEIAERGIRIISLADTVGLATPEQISFALQALIPHYPGIDFGVHLHSAPHQRIAKLEAARAAGCRRFDGALKGIGGCPMAQDELVGNMDTGLMIDYFGSAGELQSINKMALQESLRIAGEIFV
jgi:hydroxymethylglutaryl-CoA lyase